MPAVAHQEIAMATTMARLLYAALHGGALRITYLRSKAPQFFRAADY